MKAICASLLVFALFPAHAQSLKDCAGCPELVVVPAGRVLIGSTEAETARENVPMDYAARERPQVTVTIAKPFAVGKFEVTRGQYARFIAASGYMPPRGCAVWDFPKAKFADDATKSWENPGFVQVDSEPVLCVSFGDAMAYTKWLSDLTGKRYRLLSETEWEYAARAGTSTARHWGEGREDACKNASVFDLGAATKVGMVKGVDDQFSCADDGFTYTAPVGSFSANAFGLHDMLGNASEWVMDCYNPTYDGAPADGSARLTGNCAQRLTRGGAWSGKPWIVRAAERGRANADGRNSPLGFRVARELD
jgi:formylglycine-generating enzyme required for sulfatase activity